MSSEIEINVTILDNGHVQYLYPIPLPSTMNMLLSLGWHDLKALSDDLEKHILGVSGEIHIMENYLVHLTNSGLDDRVLPAFRKMLGLER